VNEYVAWLALLVAWLLALYGVAATSLWRSAAAGLVMAGLLWWSEATVLQVVVLGVMAVPLGRWVRTSRARRVDMSQPVEAVTA
jgi:hypothetical protein